MLAQRLALEQVLQLTLLLCNRQDPTSRSFAWLIMPFQKVRHQIARRATHHDQTKQRPTDGDSKTSQQHQNIQSHAGIAGGDEHRAKGDGGERRAHGRDQDRRRRDANQGQEVATIKPHRSIY